MDILTREGITAMAQQELEDVARSVADYITIRDYDDFGSNDIKRLTTPEENTTIFNIVYSLLLAYSSRENSDLDSLLDMAEYSLHRFIPNINTYCTVYIPIKKMLGKW